jgi:hypothetical protein
MTAGQLCPEIFREYVLTVESDEVMLDSTDPSPVDSPDNQLALRDSIPLALLQHVKHGCSHNRQDNSDSSESPSPVIFMEPLGNLGSGKGSNDIRGRRVGVCKTSILEVRSISGKDIDRKDHAGESDRCEYLQSLASPA